MSDIAGTMTGVLCGTHEYCTECGSIQPGQSGQCRSCGECSTETGQEGKRRAPLRDFDYPKERKGVGG